MEAGRAQTRRITSDTQSSPISSRTSEGQDLNPDTKEDGRSGRKNPVDILVPGFWGRDSEIPRIIRPSGQPGRWLPQVIPIGGASDSKLVWGSEVGSFGDGYRHGHGHGHGSVNTTPYTRPKPQLPISCRSHHSPKTQPPRPQAAGFFVETGPRGFRNRTRPPPPKRPSATSFQLPFFLLLLVPPLGFPRG